MVKPDGAPADTSNGPPSMPDPASAKVPALHPTRQVSTLPAVDVTAAKSKWCDEPDEQMQFGGFGAIERRLELETRERRKAIIPDKHFDAMGRQHTAPCPPSSWGLRIIFFRD